MMHIFKTIRMPFFRCSLVADNSRSVMGRRFTHIYLSKNGTPWHHSRISLLGGKLYRKWAQNSMEECVCDECTLSHTQCTEGGK